MKGKDVVSFHITNLTRNYFVRPSRFSKDKYDYLRLAIGMN